MCQHYHGGESIGVIVVPGEFHGQLSTLLQAYDAHRGYVVRKEKRLSLSVDKDNFSFAQPKKEPVRKKEKEPVRKKEQKKEPAQLRFV